MAAKQKIRLILTRDKARLRNGKVTWKHPSDQNHGKRGWVGGNPRYDRRNPTEGKDRSMKSLGR